MENAGKERWKEEYAPKQPEDDWNPLFVEALHRHPYIEYLLDLLLSASIEVPIQEIRSNLSNFALVGTVLLHPRLAC